MYSMKQIHHSTAVAQEQDNKTLGAKAT